MREALPVVCLQKSASKQICDENSFIESDKILIKGTVEDVGTVTNRATNIESFKANFPRDSKEWKELDYRVQACIAISQNSIDCAKGIKIEYGFPKSWILQKPNIISDRDTEEEKQRKQFYQTLVCDKKPYFFIYVYEHLKKEYNKLKRDEDKRCLKAFGKTLQEVLDNPETQEEKDAVFYYNRKKIVDESPSVMNKIAWFVEEEFKKFSLPKPKKDEYIELLKSDKAYSKTTYGKILPLYEEYVKTVRNLNNKFLLNKTSSSEKTLIRETTFNELKIKMLSICSNEEELCNILIDICYKNSKNSKHFAWTMCGEQIIKNLLSKNENKVSYPILTEDEEFDFEYKGYKFRMFTKECE